MSSFCFASSDNILISSFKLGIMGGNCVCKEISFISIGYINSFFIGLRVDVLVDSVNRDIC